MGFNRRPLVLGFNDTTLIPSGLVEVVLNLSDNGDVCDTKPSDNQVLAWDGTEWCGSSIQFTGGGGGSFTCADLGSCDLSALNNVCSDAATAGQVLAFNGTNYCPSSLPNAVPPPLPTGAPGDILVVKEGDTAFATSLASSTLFTNGIAANNITVAGDLTALVSKDQSSSDGEVLVSRGTGGFTGKITSGTFFDKGIADKNIVVDGDLTALVSKNQSTSDGDVLVSRGTGGFTGKITSGTLFDRGIADKNIVVDGDLTALVSKDQSTSDGEILVSRGTGGFTGKIASGTLFDEGLAANNLNTIGDVGYTSVENGMTLVRAGGQWKALSPPQFFNVKGEGGNDFEGDSLGLAAAIDHGLALSGLGDDDHPQYVLSAGTRAMTELTVNNNISTSGIIAKNIVPNSEDGLNIRAVNISATTSVSSASITGVNILGTSITGTNVTATTQVSAPTVRGGTSVLGTLGSFTNVGATNVTGTNIVANTLAPFVGESATTLSVTANEINLSGDLNIPDYTSLTGAGVPMVLHRQVGAPVASSNSTSLAELVSFTLPANSLAIGDIDIRIRGRQLAQGSNLRWNFKIGGTNILNSNISQGTFSDMTVYNMHIQISKTETDKQLVTANFTQSTGSGSAAGRGSWAGTHRVGQITNDGVTADESTALALSLEAQQADAAQIVTVDQFRVTLIPDPA